MGSGATVAQRPLEPLILGRIQAPQLVFYGTAMIVFEEEPPDRCQFYILP